MAKEKEDNTKGRSTINDSDDDDNNTFSQLWNTTLKPTGYGSACVYVLKVVL